jgi:hypothetical protein
MRLNFFLIVFIIFNGCFTSKSKETLYYLHKQHSSYLVQGKPIAKIECNDTLIRLTIEYYKKNKPITKVKVFQKFDNQLYEQKLITNFENKVIDTVFVLASSKNDTSVIYKYNCRRYISSMPHGFDDWIYQIQNAAGHKLTKKHLTDSTFKEEFYFDNNYRLQKLNLYYGSDTLMFEK